MRAVYGQRSNRRKSTKAESDSNIFSLMDVVSKEDTIKFFNEQYNTMKIRYGDMKKQLAEDMISFTSPFREKITGLLKDDALIHKIAKHGEEKARESAVKPSVKPEKLLVSGIFKTSIKGHYPF